MDEKTLTALKGSIAKWEGIVAGTAKDNGCDNCPLCQLFHPECGGRHGNTYADDACDGCPVKEETGEILCGGSPYDDYDPDNHSEDAARAELDFLRALLPATEPVSAVIAEERGTK